MQLTHPSTQQAEFTNFLKELLEANADALNLQIGNQEEIDDLLDEAVIEIISEGTNKYYQIGKGSYSRKNRNIRRKENRQNVVSILKDLYIEIQRTRFSLNQKRNSVRSYTQVLKGEEVGSAPWECLLDSYAAFVDKYIQIIIHEGLQAGHDALPFKDGSYCDCFDPVEEDDAAQQFPGYRPIRHSFDPRIEHRSDCPYIVSARQNY